jgi:16S rRNA (guanine527-N7)-methyltransferase
VSGGHAALVAALEEARARGLLGPGPVEAHLDHTRAWAAHLEPAPARVLDLGSGGGVPGLVLAVAWPGSRVTLLDSRRRAAGWLREAATRLGLSDRVSVVCTRAEEAGRDRELREAFPLVVARGFGQPAVTAECGSAFVAPGGRLSVSDPPGGDPARWPAERLAELGLGPAAISGDAEASFVLLPKTAALDERWPRRVGRPARRPLWR